MRIYFHFLLCFACCCASAFGVEFHMIIPDLRVKELFFEDEGVERRISFENGRFTSRKSFRTGDTIKLYRKGVNEAGGLIEIPYCSFSFHESAQEIIAIVSPNRDLSAEAKKVKVIDILNDARVPNSFYMINATGYPFAGQVNGKQFLLPEEYGADQIIGFEPLVIERKGRAKKVIVLAEFAFKSSDQWTKLNSLKQYLYWKEGMSNVVVLIRDPGRQYDYDINLIRLN